MPRRPRYDTRIDGVLAVDKPRGVTSARVVAKVRHAAGNCKTGHAGTLDPLATGLLLCCLGSATKLVDRLMADTKAYLAEVDLSAFTTTDDAEGERDEVVVDPEDQPTHEGLCDACEALTGWIEQTPPAYSAIHIDGRRAYQLARAGEAVTLKPRRVRVDRIDVLHYAWPIARVGVTCGKGVYIRSLARDLGRAMGTGGHLASLRRTRIGAFDVAEAVAWERLDEPVTQADLRSVPEQADRPT